VRRHAFLVLLVPAAFAAGVYLSPSVRGAEARILGSTAISWEEIQAKVPAGGRAAQVLRDPTATLDELELHVTFLPAGQSPHPPHKHADEEIVIIKEGTVEALVNGEAKRLGPGSVIFQAANQMHGLKNVGNTTAVYHVVKWNSPGMLAKRPAP
jgi:XRE family transcriptional regulator, regulator of sulfur utilization